MKKLWTVLIIMIFIFSGCKKEVEKVVTVETPPVNIGEETNEDDIPIIDEKKQEKEGQPSPLSGIYVSEDRINKRVVGIMFDNHPRARWQAGLKDAEIVYEFPVEAPYTRYFGLYLINSPENIGPIRSARPYFITKALEFDAIYVHVGGSEQAKSDIKTLKIADIDGLTSSSKVFWRNKNKKAPNNLYSSMEVLRQTQEERGYNLNGTFKCFKFNEDDEDIVGNSGKSILINYMRNNSTTYTYDEDNKVYLRQKDGKDHIDESDGSQIIAKNIIIQEVSTKVLDNEGRLEVDLIGEGTGKYFTNGNFIDIKWVKKNRSEKTYYYDSNGVEIVLNPGVTWIQVINKNSDIVIE